MDDGAGRSGERRVLEYAVPARTRREGRFDRYMVWVLRLGVLFWWMTIIDPHQPVTLGPALVAGFAIWLGLRWRGGWIDSMARWVYLLVGCAQFAISISWWVREMS